MCCLVHEAVQKSCTVALKKPHSLSNFFMVVIWLAEMKTNFKKN